MTEWSKAPGCKASCRWYDPRLRLLIFRFLPVFRSSVKPIQMNSSMTFLQSNRCDIKTSYGNGIRIWLQVSFKSINVKTGLFKFRFVDFKDTIEISRSIFQDVIWAWSLDINDPPHSNINIRYEWSAGIAHLNPIYLLQKNVIKLHLQVCLSFKMPFHLNVVVVSERVSGIATDLILAAVIKRFKIHCISSCFLSMHHITSFLDHLTLQIVCILKIKRVFFGIAEFPSSQGK